MPPCPGRWRARCSAPAPRRPRAARHAHATPARLRPATRHGSDDVPAAGLAGQDLVALPHVGETGRDQRDVLGAQPARGAHQQQQFQQLLVGTMQAAIDDHPARQGLGQPQMKLVIEEAMPLDDRALDAHSPGQAFRLPGFIVEVQQQGIHQYSTNKCRSGAAKRRQAPIRAGEWRLHAGFRSLKDQMSPGEKHATLDISSAAARPFRAGGRRFPAAGRTASPAGEARRCADGRTPPLSRRPACH